MTKFTFGSKSHLVSFSCFMASVLVPVCSHAAADHHEGHGPPSHGPTQIHHEAAHGQAPQDQAHAEAHQGHILTSEEEAAHRKAHEASASELKHHEAAHQHGAKGHGGHEEHHRFYLGGAAVALAAFENPTALHYGGGGFFGIAAVPGWLDIEFVVHTLVGPHGVVDLPIEVLFKKPFHATPRLHPFIALGPSMMTVFEPNETLIFFGGASATGFDVWMSKKFALFAEINFNLLYRTITIGAAHDDTAANTAHKAVGLVPELGGSVGFIFGL